jgi:aminoglycoside phosphotransferase (APT) family kinase protein
MSKMLQKKKDGPSEVLIKSIIGNGFLKGKTIASVTRMLSGNTTFVYRIETENKVYYARLLPNDGRFDIEFVLHGLLLENNIIVPKILWYEKENVETRLSLMIVEEMPGKSLEENYPPDNDLQTILCGAGRQLAKINRIIDINGFGVFDTRSHGTLKGEKESFDEYYSHYFESYLDVLSEYPFSAREIIFMRKIAENAKKYFYTKKSVLVLGDFSLDHIFHRDGKFTGMIDLGKVSGSNRMYDLGYITGFYQNRTILASLLEGYRQITPLSEKDLFSVEFIAFCVVLKMLGLKANTDRRFYWYEIMKEQLKEMYVL